MNSAYCKRWIEAEKGWGTRPDGISLHQSPKAAKEYITKYWNGMPDVIPNEYSRPNDSERIVLVSDIIAARLIENGGSIRLYAHQFIYKADEEDRSIIHLVD